MIQVPDLESFNKLARQVQHLAEENEFLKTLLLGERWLNRREAMIALGCRDDKLRQLTLAKRLTYRYEGKAPFYCVFSIRSYLTAQKIDQREADKRVLSARLSAELS